MGPFTRHSSIQTVPPHRNDNESSSSLASGYKSLSACSVFMAVGLSTSFLVNQHFFYLLDCICMLSLECVLSFILDRCCNHLRL
jgi:hypothetical protein